MVSRRFLPLAFSASLVVSAVVGPTVARAEDRVAVASSRLRTIERSQSELQGRLRVARARRDNPKALRLDDLVNQVGATARRAAAVRAEIVALLAEGDAIGGRLTELAFLEKRARELGRDGAEVDGEARSAKDGTVVVFRDPSLPDEPKR